MEAAQSARPPDPAATPIWRGAAGRVGGGGVGGGGGGLKVAGGGRVGGGAGRQRRWRSGNGDRDGVAAAFLLGASIVGLEMVRGWRWRRGL